MNAEVMKSFLVSLGFDVDESGQRKFETTLTGVTANALKAGTAIEAAALSVVAFTAKIASGLDELFWASQRTGASVQGIKEVGYAVSQVGGDANAARTSLENLARFLRNNPGAEGFLNRLGVQTRDASGRMRDMSQVFADAGRQLSKMPYYRANQYAQMLGIDENTLMAMRRGLGQYQGEYSAMAKAIGFNADRAAESSNRFMTSLKSFGTLAGLARDKIGSGLADGLADSLDTLRKRVMDNFPKIEAVITRGVKGILRLADIINHLVFRLIQGADALARWWSSLSKSTRDLIKLLGALTVALRLMNTAFWMSPIGIITALAGAIALLWDDYQTWKEGGKSLIDWGKWKPQIDTAMKALAELQQSITALKDALLTLLGIDPKTWSLKWDFENFITQMGELGKMLNMIADLLNAINEGRWGDAAKIGQQLLKQGSEKPAAQSGVTSSADETAAWIADKTGFDPRSIGHTVRRWMGLDLVEAPERPSQTAQGTPPVALDIPGNAPRGIRNNNPGNLNYVGQQGATLERPGGRFARFESAFDGLRALGRQLLRYFDGKTTGRRLQSVRDIISTWAPASDNNNTAAYIAQIARHLNVAPDAALNLRDPETLSRLMNGIIRHENGANPYQRELVAAAANSATGRGAEVNQSNTYHIYGGGDPRLVASEVERRQVSANSMALRNQQTKVG
ncbi:lytic transglycosylase [Jejubacter calystegiae]|uniref:Lytic transglycosylase n=1 Tax=Jejubacter calystegiae TaxID=2579935 RepID=A0A4P8YQ68_9ENTR|nr:lytic transglycosylase [Jejubacter calystegiae]QCT20842.1 lytic transglycosylase [Jejubacter calystegiae]